MSLNTIKSKIQLNFTCCSVRHNELSQTLKVVSLRTLKFSQLFNFSDVYHLTLSYSREKILPIQINTKSGDYIHTRDTMGQIIGISIKHLSAEI